MTKEEAKEKLRKAESELRRAEVVMEMHENGVRELKEDIEKLTAIINKKDDWRDKLVDPEIDKHFYISVDITSRYGVDWLKPMSGCNRNATLLFKEKSHAQLLADKIQLMQEMYAFAHVRNEGWVPDWGNDEQIKWGLITDTVEGIYLYSYFNFNPFIFGITVKSEEIAEEMLEEFGKRIEKIYNKQY